MDMIIITDEDGRCYAHPFLINVSTSEEAMLTAAWNPQGNRYIAEPLSHSQCLAYMYEQLTYAKKQLFHVRKHFYSKEEYLNYNTLRYYQKTRYPKVYTREQLDAMEKARQPIAMNVVEEPKPTDNVEWVIVKDMKCMHIKN